MIIKCSGSSFFRLWFFLIVFLVLCFLNPGYSQDTSSAKKPINEILSDVERVFQIKIFLKKGLVDEGHNLELSLSSREEALKEIENKLNLTLLEVYPDTYVCVRPDSYKSDLPINRVVSSKKIVSITGKVNDAISSKPIEGATIYIPEMVKGTNAGSGGSYRLELPQGYYSIVVKNIGYEDEIKKIRIDSDVVLNFNLFDKSVQLDEVVVRGGLAEDQVNSVQTGRTTMNIKTLKKMPAFMGEVDIVKSILTLPGISTVGEGATGFNVRGGNIDQNLILYNDAVVFNSSHLLGFFSIFNPDVVKDFTLYTGGIPANYGGRVSSVLDIRQRAGNKDKFSVTGGLGIISSKLLIEGPTQKERGSFIIGGRYAYPDWMLGFVKDVKIRNSSSNFWDFNFNYDHILSKNDKVDFSVYISEDNFKFASDTLFKYKNMVASVRWNHAFSASHYLDFSLSYSKYESNLSNLYPTMRYIITNGIALNKTNIKFTFLPGVRHKVEYGIEAQQYEIRPGKLSPDNESDVISKQVPDESAIEFSAFISEEFKISPKLGISGGIRYSVFKNLGPGFVPVFEQGMARSVQNVIDTIFYNNNEVIQTYSGFEPRFSFKYQLSTVSSIKAGFQRNYQFIHLLSNSIASLPTDYWKASSQLLQPLTGNQISLGYFRNVGKNIEVSVEGYYKELENVVDYKDGTQILLNTSLETDLVTGKGKAYGTEVSFKKNNGKVTGWASYTYSRSLRQIDSEFEEERINNGRFFPSNYDKPHDLKFATTLEITRRWSFSANFTYSSGRPATYPEAKFIIGNKITVGHFSERNSFRIPDYHRLDFSVTLDESLKRKQKWKGSWSFSVYNVYGRKNAFSVYFLNVYGAPPSGYKLAVLGMPFPSVSYNFKF